MIKRLRRKLTIIIMVPLAVVLVLILVIIYNSTAASLEKSSMDALRIAAEQYDFPPFDNRKPERPRPSASITPCFVVGLDPRGNLNAAGSDYYDLTDTGYLMEVLTQAQQTGKARGVLEGYSLRFLRLEETPGMRYAFTDISTEQASLTGFLIFLLVVGTVTLLCFFGLSLIIARWAVRPVERAWNQQRQFVADASHELKTPLTVILTNAELLRSEEYSPEDKLRFSDSILTMSHQMRGLVEELLDQARVDATAATADLHPLDFSQLVSDAVLPFEPVYFEADRELLSSVNQGLRVKGSADRLRQVVEILLDNGCKYSSPGSTVELKLTRQKGNCLLTVTSLGAAMTEQECKDIFKRFYRADRARSMNHSYGLGLSIAQTIVTAHHGKIYAHSQDGKNTFTVLLPLA